VRAAVEPLARLRGYRTRRGLAASAADGTSQRNRRHPAGVWRPGSIWFHDVVHRCLASSPTPPTRRSGHVAGTAGGHRRQGRGTLDQCGRWGPPVCRRWVHELLKQFDAEGEAGLAPRSPAGVRLLQDIRRQLLHPPRLEAVSTRPSRLPRNLPSSGVRVRPLFHDQWDITLICTTSSNYCGNKYDYGLEIPMFQ
jgi:hypothetical protein